jgi:hypothetical protein
MQSLELLKDLIEFLLHLCLNQLRFRGNFVGTSLVHAHATLGYAA